MKSTWERQLLIQLLAKYEAIQQNLPATTSRRRVQLSFQSGEFLPYNAPDHAQKEQIHELLEELRADGLLDFIYVRAKTPRQVQRVWLNLDSIAAVYNRAQMLSPLKQAETVLEAVLQLGREMPDLLDWITSILKDAAAVLEQEKQLAPPLPLQEKQALLLLLALRQLAGYAAGLPWWLFQSPEGGLFPLAAKSAPGPGQSCPDLFLGRYRPGRFFKLQPPGPDLYCRPGPLAYGQG